MRNTMISACALAILGITGSAPADAQGVPDPIKARVNEMVAQCARAGGQLGAMTGQGQFVIPRDFTGDGTTDFLVSEGNFPCAGKPDLFRQGGTARLQLFMGDGAGGASLLFDDRLLGYRIIDGKPPRLQIARAGDACGGPARCGDELRWNAGARGFDLVATDGRSSAPRRVGLAAAAPVAVTAAPAGKPAAGAARPLPVAANAQAEFRAQCRRETLAGNPQAAKWVDGHCTEQWDRVVAAGPAADALLGVLPATAGAAIALADAKARMTGVRWGPAARGMLATGTIGKLTATLQGARAPDRAAVNWMAVGQPVPFDMVGAMRARGVTLTLASCQKLGAGEGNRTYSGTAAGRAPFSLLLDTREAPTANANSYLAASVSLSGRAPPRGSTNCEDF